jgi:PAS domain S-box-containing protein
MQNISQFVLEKLNTLVVVIDENARATFVSPAAKTILGYAPETLLGDAWFNLTRKSNEERNAIKELVSKTIKGEVTELMLPNERLLYASSGAEKWIFWNTVKGPENTLISLGYDITDRKKSELSLHVANKNLERKNKEIVESIQYALRIQEAILPSKSLFYNSFSEAFVLYKPKDIVSGDFYWFFERDNCVYVAAIDCTGHGVPGALMSVIANSLFKEVFSNKEILEPNDVLVAIDIELQKELGKNPDKVKASDGMDVALIKVDKTTNQLSFSGAFRPMLILRNNTVLEFRGSRYPIGQYGNENKVFEKIEIELLQGDQIYIFSDGFVDQFGGENGKKLNRARFKELLLTIADMEMKEQEAFLEYAFNNWKQQEEQTDDVLVIGLKY